LAGPRDQATELELSLHTARLKRAFENHPFWTERSGGAICGR
jgi:hypothetical protein